MLVIPNSLSDVPRQHTIYLVNCWKLTRADGRVLRFTDHDAVLIFSVPGEDGIMFEYLPSGGLSASAQQKESQLKPHNFEAVGAITSDQITEGDLRSGRYRQCQIDNYVVDWRAPWAGPLVHRRYWIDETKFNGVNWEATMGSLSTFLEPIQGEVYQRICGADLGDDRCKVNLVPLTVTDVSILTVVDDVTFECNPALFSGPNQDQDDWFNFGLVRWNTGANKDLVSEVRSYVAASARFVIQIPPPGGLSVNDEFDVYPGCDKTTMHCHEKFDNIENMRAYPFLPGEDSLNQRQG